MTELCPKCHYERKPSDEGPPGVCPSCGTDHERYRQAVQAQAANVAALASFKRKETKSRFGWLLTLLVGVLGFVLGYASGQRHERKAMEAALEELGAGISFDTGAASDQEVQPVSALLLSKAFDDRPVRDAITFEVEFENLEDRAIIGFEGVLSFLDLKGKPILAASFAIEDTIAPLGTYHWHGEFNYIPSREEHVRLRQIPVDEIQVQVDVESVRHAAD